jgi:transposase
MEGIFSMGKIRKTYDVKFKKKAVDLYLKEGMSSETVAKKLGIHHSMVIRWVKHFDREGMKGLEEKRGRQKLISQSRRGQGCRRQIYPFL